MNFLLSLNLAPEPFWWRLPSQTKCSVFLTSIQGRAEIPFLAGRVFPFLKRGGEKKRSPRAAPDKLSLLRLSSKSSGDVISSSLGYRNNIYPSCSQYPASAAQCCGSVTSGCSGWRRGVQTQAWNTSPAGTAGQHPRKMARTRSEGGGQWLIPLHSDRTCQSKREALTLAEIPSTALL